MAPATSCPDLLSHASDLASLIFSAGSSPIKSSPLRCFPAPQNTFPALERPPLPIPEWGTAASPPTTNPSADAGAWRQDLRFAEEGRARVMANMTSAVASRNATCSKKVLLAIVSRTCSSADRHRDRGLLGDNKNLAGVSSWRPEDVESFAGRTSPAPSPTSGSSPYI